MATGGGFGDLLQEQFFKPRHLSLDLVVGKDDGRIHYFGVVRGNMGYGDHSGVSASDLARLDVPADGTAFLRGRNLIACDLFYFRAGKPDLQLRDMPVID